MSDREDIIRELERAGWWLVDDSGVFTAVHPDGSQPIRFGGRFGWTLRSIRRDASEALGKHTGRSTAKRHKITAKQEASKIVEARHIYLANKQHLDQREQVRVRVIARDNELRDIARLMQPGR